MHPVACDGSELLIDAHPISMTRLGRGPVNFQALSSRFCRTMRSRCASASSDHLFGDDEFDLALRVSRLQFGGDLLRQGAEVHRLAGERRCG